MGKEKRNMYDPFMKRIIWRKTNCINVLKNYYIHKKRKTIIKILHNYYHLNLSCFNKSNIETKL